MMGLNPNQQVADHKVVTFDSAATYSKIGRSL